MQSWGSVCASFFREFVELRHDVVQIFSIDIPNS